ncbi:MAG TPA: ATP phosphoribosyltransferase regulatory subunit [Kofleriaceae bacterium]|nr:ATP phosphoribosyltransferase regulatory subunit [Kofleriaceae bacterium]
MSTPPIRLPSGVRDFLPRAAAIRHELAERVTAVFDAWGYARVVTPVFEHAEVLERGLGAGARAAAIRFVEPGTGEVVALRPDITPQIARLVATRLADAPGPIRLCYEGASYRLGRTGGEPGQREIVQAGIELYDAPSPDGDAEVLAVAAAALGRVALAEWRLELGHVAPGAFVLDSVPADARDALAAALARKDRAGVRAAVRGLPVAPVAEALAQLWGPAAATLDRADALAWPAHVRAALAELRAVIAAFGELAEPPLPALSIDLGDVRGFEYYTGVRFAAYAVGAGQAVARGGRYDELVGRYGRARRATGFAIDLEAIAEAHHRDPERTLGIATDDPALARALRVAGVRAVVQRAAPADWPSWLASAGLDAAIVAGKLEPSGIAAPTDDIDALIALLEGH